MINGKVNSRRYVWFIAVHIALASFIFAYSLGVFSTSQDNVAHSMGWSSSEKSLYTALFSAFIPVGSLIGSLFTASLCNKIGRFKGLLVLDLITIISSFLSALPYTISFAFGRFIAGISCGMCIAISPLYIGEMTPQQMMHSIGPLISIMASFGLITSYAFGLLLPIHDLSQNMNYFWCFMFAFPGIIAAYQAIIFLVFIRHDSPVFYIRYKKIELYYDLLGHIFEANDIENEKLKKNFEVTNDSNGFVTESSFFNTLFKPEYRKMVRIGIVLGSMQQFSGQDAILFYSVSIFKKLGLSVEESRIFSVGIGVITLLASIGTIGLLKYVGRKPMLFYGFFFTFIDLFLVAFFSQIIPSQSILSASLVVVFFIFNASSLVCTFWSYIGEIQVDKAITITASCNKFWTIVIVITFPYAVEMIGFAPAAYFFAACMLATAVYIKFDLVETKGKTKEEIENLIFPKNNKIDKSSSLIN